MLDDGEFLLEWCEYFGQPQVWYKTQEKTPCKYGPIFAPYLHDWTLYGINTVQKRVRIYMAFFLCKLCTTTSCGTSVMYHCLSLWSEVWKCYIYICNTFTPQIKGRCHCIKILMWYCTGSGMLTRYTHWYQCIYLVKTFHKSLKLFDDKMKLLHSIYSRHQLNILAIRGKILLPED